MFEIDFSYKLIREKMDHIHYVKRVGKISLKNFSKLIQKQKQFYLENQNRFITQHIEQQRNRRKTEMTFK